MRLYLLRLILLLVLVLAGCNGRSTETAVVVEPTATATTAHPTATALPMVTATPQPTATVTSTPAPTATPAPTETAQPTSTPSPTPTAELLLSLEERYTVAAAGFSFIPLPLYAVDIQGRQVALFDPAGDIIISLMGIPNYTEDSDAGRMLDEFLDEVAQSGGGQLEQGESQAILIDGREGVTVSVAGHLFNFPLRGQAVAVFEPGELFFFGLAIANVSQETQRWEMGGRPAFESVLAGIQFLTGIDQLVCAIATDETYGYTEENPVPVGGGAFGGPSRAHAYLDNLLGPNGEELSYQRIGSLPFEDTILDIYEISGLSQPAQLYLDSYTSGPLQAPVGFTCVPFFP